MKRSIFEQFAIYMIEVCGSYSTEDGAVICSECGEPIYEEDFRSGNPNEIECPCCGFNIMEEE